MTTGQYSLGLHSTHQFRDCVRQLIPSCRTIPSCCTTKGTWTTPSVTLGWFFTAVPLYGQCLIEISVLISNCVHRLKWDQIQDMDVITSRRDQMSIQQCIFPNCLKNAELSPVFKKDDSMNKTNFRPVSILVCFSKVFEKLYCDQLLDFFNKVVSKFLSAFRKGYSCETVLIKMIEDWRKC